MKSHKIGNRTLVSDFLLPANIDIIFLSSLINEDKSILDLLSCSSNGCPTKVFGIFSLSKYFFSKLKRSKFYFLNF